jgi:hypothetical protein
MACMREKLSMLRTLIGHPKSVAILFSFRFS